jgi:DNA-binding CsgD family transcriptional regulator
VFSPGNRECDHAVVNHRTRERAFDRMAKLVAAEMESSELIDEATALLAAALPHDSACWHLMDPATLIETGFAAKNMPPADVRVARFAFLPDDYNSHVALARGKRHSGVLSDATAGRPDRSVRYRELLRPNNVLGELRTALVIDGTCWGNVSLFREAPRDFTLDERDFAHEVASLLGRGLRTAGVRARSTGPGAALWPGVLLLDEHSQVVSITEPARWWLEELGFTGDPAHDPLPFAVHALTQRARADTRAEVRLTGASGRWVSMHASPAAGGQPGHVAVVLQATPPASIAPLIAAAYGFSARERELVELVLQGCSTREIAERMFISPLTVQTHLKSVFAKAGVRSRRELVGRVHGSPGA